MEKLDVSSNIKATLTNHNNLNVLIGIIDLTVIFARQKFYRRHMSCVDFCGRIAYL
jgi:hypothetical protein